GGGYGGGIDSVGGNSSNATLTVTHSRLADNRATGGQGGTGAGGGAGRGGGIASVGVNTGLVGFATLDLSHSELESNRATGGAGGAGVLGGAGGNGAGGGGLTLRAAEDTARHTTPAADP